MRGVPQGAARREEAMNWTEERSFGASLDELTRQELLVRPEFGKWTEADIQRYKDNRPQDWQDYEAAAKLDWKCTERLWHEDDIHCESFRFEARDSIYHYTADISYWDEDDHNSYSRSVIEPKTPLKEILILCLKEKLAELVKKP
jgi:hypothetical protein